MRSLPPVHGVVYGIRGVELVVGVGVGVGDGAVDVSEVGVTDGVGAGGAHGARVSSYTAVALSPPPQKLAPQV